VPHPPLRFGGSGRAVNLEPTHRGVTPTRNSPDPNEPVGRSSGQGWRLMVKFNLDDLLKFLESHGFKDIVDDINAFMDLHPCSDNVDAFEVDMFSENKPKIYAIVKIDIEKWIEELTSDDPA
jgi:hypothetical protein